MGALSLPVPYSIAQDGPEAECGRYDSRTFPSPELDHIRYVCMVDDGRAREVLGFTPTVPIEETVRSVNADRW